MKHFLTITLVPVFIAGCATTEGYIKLVESWEGSSEVHLIRHWGTPEKIYESGESKFLEFISSRNVYFPGTSPFYTRRVYRNRIHTFPVGGTPARTVIYRCQTTFEIINETVVGYNFKGNDCRADPDKN